MNTKNGFALKVKKNEATLVPPAENPYKGPYFLSILDLCTLDPVAAAIGTIYCFNSTNEKNDDDDDVFQVIKDSLSRVLVHYYPFAGRLEFGEEGKPIVNCNGEGAVMVEAWADWEIKELGDLTNPKPEISEMLLYSIHGVKCITDVPPLVVQVTKFKCGGFVLGLTMNHCLVDGIAAMEFVNSWGEIARGLPISLTPFMDRQLLKCRNPPKPDHPQKELQPIISNNNSNNSSLIQDENHGNLQFKSFSFPPEKLEKLKAMAMKDNSVTNITKCTRFEALTALVWRARTKALGTPHDQQVKLLIPVDRRSRFDPPLPKGYFGNAVLFTSSICKAGDMMENPLSFTLDLVQKAIKMVSDSYLRSAVDYRELMYGKPWPALIATLIINTWVGFPICTTDFGWGLPFHWGPTSCIGKEVVLFIPHGTNRASLKVLVCLPEKDMSSFEQAMEF